MRCKHGCEERRAELRSGEPVVGTSDWREGVDGKQKWGCRGVLWVKRRAVGLTGRSCGGGRGRSRAGNGEERDASSGNQAAIKRLVCERSVDRLKVEQRRCNVFRGPLDHSGAAKRLLAEFRNPDRLHQICEGLFHFLL